MSADDRPGREIAHRLFAAEYDDATLSHAESDRERAPNYVITPTGARVNRLFVVGTVTEVSSVNEDMIRARVVDPTGAFVVYAGQYQPDELAALESIEPPAFVAITGKARTFQPDDSDQVYTSIRPESVATVDVDTRDRWVVDAAERTIDRIETYAAAAGLDAAGEELTDALLAAGVDEGLANGIPLAQSHYGTTPGYLDALRDLSIEAVAVVAGERDQVEGFDRRPDESGTADVTFGDLAGDVDLSTPETAEPTSAETGEPEAAPDETATADTGVADGTVGTAETTTVEDEAGDTLDEPTTDEPTAAPDESVDEAPAAADDDVSTSSADSEDASDDTSSTGADDLGDFDAGDEMYEMDEEERERIESEFGTEFSTGAEVDDPGEADIDAPDETLENGAEGGPSAGADATVESGETAEPDATEPVETEPGDESGPTDTISEEPAEPTEDAEAAAEETEETGAVDEEPAADADEPAESGDVSAEDVDVQDLVVETMTELDEGDGADRAAVVDSVVEQTGLSEAEVEDAIQEALMGGQCYEPDDETLKAI